MTIEFGGLQFRALLESAPDAIVIIDSNGKIVLVNIQTENLFGYSRTDMLGNSIEMLVPSRDRERHIGHRDRFALDPHPRSMGVRLDLQGLRKDGTEFPVEVSLSTLDTQDGMLFSSAIRDVTDRKLIEREDHLAQVELSRINQELQVARDAAIFASKAKSDFLASMSHEIRTPLNGVLATASLLSQKKLDQGVRYYAEMISRTGTILMRVMDDILDMSKIEAGRMEVEPVVESLKVIVEDIVALHRNSAQGRGLTLQFEFLEPLPPAVMIDGSRLRQVLGNLVGNSVKFTESGGVAIQVSAVPIDGDLWSVKMTVNDTGIGIAPQALTRIFEPFAQGDGETYHRFGGSGLGLAISKRIIELIGGDLTVESTVGVGSNFTIQLTCIEAQLEPLPPAEVLGSSRRGLSVLLAEDNEINAIVAKEMLTLLDCEVIHAEDGIEAVHYSEKQVFDLILLDVHMPNMSGIDACRMIRAGEKNQPTVMGALTASVTTDKVAKCLEVGMDFVLGKPFSVEKIRDLLIKYFPESSRN